CEFGSQEKGVSQSTREGKVAVGLRAIGRTSPGWDLSHLNATETAVIEPLLQRYEELFQPPGAEGCTVGVKHQIPTGLSFFGNLGTIQLTVISASQKSLE
ncbi:hypothetical protein ACUWC3_28075, partial [Klebsiella pneumoniae]|uniref:hypothetical protein n=1 Tax=Klebsiella pneumoniae TaxID=573 RepID=UPI00405570AC